MAIEDPERRHKQGNATASVICLAVFQDVDQTLRGRCEHFEMDTVLCLEDFERFVFVLSALEHYSDCAGLLGCSVPQIRKAQARALEELMDSSQRNLSKNQPM